MDRVALRSRGTMHIGYTFAAVVFVKRWEVLRLGLFPPNRPHPLTPWLARRASTDEDAEENGKQGTGNSEQRTGQFACVSVAGFIFPVLGSLFSISLAPKACLTRNEF